MLSFFQMLFKNHYWRMLLRKATWYEVWLSLTRAHKDKRARKHVMQVVLLALAPLLCVLYLAWVIGSGAWVIIPFVIPVIWWRSRRAKQEEAPIRITPGPEPLENHEKTKEEAKALRAYFEEMTVLYAVMVARSGSESFLKEKVLPDGYEVTSRRVHLDLLKSTGVWEKMAGRDREAMMMPDGHWDWSLINRVSMGLEPLRLLRWILRIDFFLPLVGQQLRSNYSIANELVENVERVMEGEDLADTEMLEVGRDSAQVCLHRCVAEGISRGYYEAESLDTKQWAENVSRELGGRQDEDVVLGGKLVSEASEDELRWATSLSQRREEFLARAMEVVETGKVPEGVFPGISFDQDRATSQAASELAN